MSGNGDGTSKEPGEIPRLLVDLIMNQDQVTQKWLEFLITVQAGLVVALGFLVRPGDGAKVAQPAQSLQPPHAALYLIPVMGILVSVGITWIVVRERKWTAWYVARFNEVPGCKEKVFPSDKCVTGSVGSQPIGRLSQIVVGLGTLISLAWITLILWAKFFGS